MKEVAKLLGVDIGEEFKVDLDGVVYRKNFYFTEYSLFAVDDDKPEVGVLNNLLNGKYKVIKLSEPVLDKKEKEYLSYVLRPFKDEIIHIYKSPSVYEGYEEITVVMTCCKYLAFPAYEKNTMYKGMLPNKKYTLDDLGL